MTEMRQLSSESDISIRPLARECVESVEESWRSTSESARKEPPRAISTNGGSIARYEWNDDKRGTRKKL